MSRTGDFLIAMMHRIAKTNPKSIEQQCDEIYGPGMKSHWTYRKELNPTEEYARFPVSHFIDFCKATGSIEALEFMADQLGCHVSRRKEPTNVNAGPVALVKAVSKLMELEEDQAASRVELVQAANAVIEEAEVIVFRRFPHQVAFARLEDPVEKPEPPGRRWRFPWSRKG